MVNIKLKILDKGRIVEEQLIRVLQKHENAIIEGSSEDTTLSTKVSNLETAIGKASGDGAGGILKDVADVKSAIGDSSSGLTKSVSDNAGAISNLETAIGKATGEDAGGIAKDVADAQSDITTINTAIGDESTEGTILARIKALENAQNTPSNP